MNNFIHLEMEYVEDVVFFSKCFKNLTRNNHLTNHKKPGLKRDKFSKKNSDSAKNVQMIYLSNVVSDIIFIA